jgi:16S rRNA pseudouridine516 synthase
MSKRISLKQFLMRTGRFERSDDCIDAIGSGKVTINGKVVTNPSYFFNLEKSLIEFNNEKLKKVPKLYFIMNKPQGYLSQKSPKEKSIYSILEKLSLPKEHIKSLHAVGRLDKNTEGLIILTNDGELSYSAMHPEGYIMKKYYAVIEKPVDIHKIRILEKGIEITADNETYKTRPCKIEIVGEKEVYISMMEGKKRQIKKMFKAVGNNVVYLKRVSIGVLSIGDLKVGEIKEISREEVMKKIGL